MTLAHLHFETRAEFNTVAGSSGLELPDLSQKKANSSNLEIGSKTAATQSLQRASLSSVPQPWNQPGTDIAEKSCVKMEVGCFPSSTRADLLYQLWMTV